MVSYQSAEVGIMRKFQTILFAAIVLVSAAFPVGSASGVAGFGDVEANRYYTAPVQWMLDNGITTGTSAECFSPFDGVTRGQFAAFLYRMQGSPIGSPFHGFTDVTAPWQQAPVSWLKATGVTTGTSATTFSPNNALTRGQAAAMLWRLAGRPASAPSPFGDVVAPWQTTAVGWMAAQGITEGTSATTFSPNRISTRGESATFLYRYNGSPAVTVNPLPDWTAVYPPHGSCPP